MRLLAMISCTSSGLIPGNARGMILAGVRMVVIVFAFLILSCQNFMGLTHLGYSEIVAKTLLQGNVYLLHFQCTWILLL
jgi:hypothetical protein